MLKANDAFAEGSRKIKMPLITPECWAIVDDKDWPLLKWNWVKDLCATASARRILRPVASHRHQQLLRSSIRRHVARRCMAPAVDPRN